MKYADIVFNNPLNKSFQYIIPEDLRDKIGPGMFVAAPFGRRRMCGCCVSMGNESKVDVNKLKEILDVYPVHTAINPNLLALAVWISDYYMASLGEVLFCMVPTPARERKQWTDPYVWLADSAAPDRIRLSPGQKAVIEFLSSAGKPVRMSEIRKHTGIAPDTVKRLMRRAIVHKAPLAPEAPSDSEMTTDGDILLNPEQAAALETIRNASEAFHPFLLWGETASGKTEVYIRALTHVVQAGKQGLVLVPEISLTPQTIHRFQCRFKRIAVLHSRLNPEERALEWRRIREDRVDVVIGVRSAVFAPLCRPGMILVDEEHENTYKQESVPRYHARDVAVKRAHMAGIPIVLGSATPSLESYSNATNGKYTLIRMKKRVGTAGLPGIHIINLSDKAASEDGMFSRHLIDQVNNALSRNEQIILFLNRKGFATFLRCKRCGYIFHCPSCSVTLTYYKHRDHLLCHYCGYSQPFPRTCPECEFTQIQTLGKGTERIEEKTARLFPHARIVRMDTASMTRSDDYETILHDFGSGQYNILIGTQMVAKGLDFPNVTVVGVINADILLNVSDFRGPERTFQLLYQVSGRAGRAGKQGTVIIQTYSPGHPAVKLASAFEYRRFAEQELQRRSRFHYPPSARLARLVLRGRNEEKIITAARDLANTLREKAGPQERHMILGPSPCPITLIKDEFRWQVLVKGSNRFIVRISQGLVEKIKKLGIQTFIDVDPMSLL